MSTPEKPHKTDHRLQATESQRQSAAKSRETRHGNDSVPIPVGPFAQLPAKFGRYQVEKLLGRGAMGAVYLAQDTQLDRRVALKIPKVSATGAKRMLLRLQTEAKAAAKLDHPSLCKVFDAGAIDGQCFIAMKYIEGQTLKEQLSEQAKSIEEAVSIISQLADGLSEAHELGIVHRDLKPENIMINRRAIPVIMDFGLAKFATMTGSAVATQAGTILGSPAYMSPEQANGNIDEIDQRSDIYSLGIILYELLTGKWPFTGSAMQILGQKSLLEPESPLVHNPQLPPQLAAICHKMIARTNSDRYQNLHEVLADLRELNLGGATASSRLPAPQLPATERGSSIVSTKTKANQRTASVPATAEPPTVKQPAADRPGWRSRWRSRIQADWQRARDYARGSGAAIANRTRRLRSWFEPWLTLRNVLLAGGAAAGCLALSVTLFLVTRHGTLQIEIADPNVSVRFADNTITVDNDGQPIHVSVTKQHRLQVLVNKSVIDSLSRELTLKNGEKRLITVKLLDKQSVINYGDGTGPQPIPAPPVATASPLKTEAEVPFDPVPINSRWAGSLHAQSDNKPATTVSATATITARGPDQFTLYVDATNTLGPFAWEYEIQRPGPGQPYFIAKAVLVTANWNEELGEKKILSNRVTLTDTELTIKVERPVDSGSRTQTFHLERDPDDLNQRAWEVVVSADQEPAEYHQAWLAAEIASKARPHDPSLLNTLGLAQYRVKKYADAIKSLAKSEELYHENEQAGSLPSNLVFTALAKFRSGDGEGARAALEKVRERRIELGNEISTSDEQFCEEAEVAIDPPSTTLSRQIDTHGGNWSVQDDAFIQADDGSPELLAVFGDSEWTDYDYSFDVVKTGGRGGVAAVFRATGPRTCMIFDMSGGNNDHFTSMCFVDGGRIWWRSHSAHHMESGSTYRYLIKVRGSTADCYVDGTHQVTIENSAETLLLGKGAVGVRCWDASARITNIRVLAPNGKILWMGLPTP